MKQKSWAKKDNPQLHVRNARQMRVTVIGAIGTCLENGRLMQLAPSTNKVDFMAFLHNLKQAVLPRYRGQEQIIVYDGAAAHTCEDTQNYMRGYFIPLQIPPYSCEFNCKYPFEFLSPRLLAFYLPATLAVRCGGQHEEV